MYKDNIIRICPQCNLPYIHDGKWGINCNVCECHFSTRPRLIGDGLKNLTNEKRYGHWQHLAIFLGLAALVMLYGIYIHQ